MENIKNYDVTVDSGIIGIFIHRNYEIERVFAEFIDNSLQSFLDHESVLKPMPDGGKCIVNIEWNEEKILIKDNAFGMNDAEFARALKLKAINPDAKKVNRLSIFGMGLKYAAVYLGGEYKIISKCFGENNRRIAKINVKYFEENNPSTIPATLERDNYGSHGTTIEIKDLRHKRTVSLLSKLRENLGSIYQHYIEDGTLCITVNGVLISYEMPEIRVDSVTGVRYSNQLCGSFTVDSITYHYKGWAGILKVGKQTATGFKLVQAKRCIQLHYKPTKIFLTGNSFQNSRLIGEIIFEGNQNIVSFDKHQFVWPGNAEEIFLNKLLEDTKFIEINKLCKTKQKEMDNQKVNVKVFGKNKNQSDSKIQAFSLPKEVELDLNENFGNHEIDLARDIIDKSMNENHGQEDISKYNKIIVTTLNNEEISLFVMIFEGEVDDDWLNVRYSEHFNGYILKINYRNGKINSLFTTENSIVGSTKMAIKFISSMLKSQSSGNKIHTSFEIIKYLNREL